jgi:hypothetical protein
MDGEGGAWRLVLWPLGGIGFGFGLVGIEFELNVVEISRPDRVGSGFFSLSLVIRGT